jgi:hypothetical protein
MEIVGFIVALPDSPPLERAAWASLCNSHINLAPIPAKVATNPFATGEAMEIRAPDDSVNVVISGRTVGQMYWAMDDSAQVVVLGAGPDLVTVVREIAQSLSATLALYEGDQG